MRPMKVVIMGDAGVGKTSLIQQYAERKIPSSYKPTIGISLVTKEILVAGKKIELQIWDTAGEERNQCYLPLTFYSEADAFILAYSVTNARSFENIDKLLEEVGDKNIVTIIGLNKENDPTSVVVTKRHGKNYADENGVKFIECSINNSEEVDAVFEKAIEAALKEIQEEIEAEGLTEKQTIDSLYPEFSDSFTWVIKKHARRGDFAAQMETGARLFRKAWNSLKAHDPASIKEFKYILELSALYFKMAVNNETVNYLNKENKSLAYQFLYQIYVSLAKYDSENKAEHIKNAVEWFKLIDQQAQQEIDKLTVRLRELHMQSSARSEELEGVVQERKYMIAQMEELTGIAPLQEEAIQHSSAQSTSTAISQPFLSPAELISKHSSLYSSSSAATSDAVPAQEMDSEENRQKIFEPV